MEQQAVELLRKLRNIISLSGGSVMSDLVYRSPAAQMRRAADEMEARDALLNEVDRFLAHCKLYQTK